MFPRTLEKLHAISPKTQRDSFSGEILCNILRVVTIKSKTLTIKIAQKRSHFPLKLTILIFAVLRSKIGPKLDKIRYQSYLPDKDSELKLI